MERTIKIRLDGGNIIEKLITAVTFGELKSELQMDFANQKVIIRENRLTLEDDKAHLPLTDFNLFVYPLKVKNGFIGQFDTMGYNELRRLCIDNNIEKKPTGFNNYGTIVEMREKLAAAHVATDVAVEEEEVDICATCTDRVCEREDVPVTPSTKEDVLSAIDAIQISFDNLYNMVLNLQNVNLIQEVDTIAEEFEAVRKLMKPFGVA